MALFKKFRDVLVAIIPIVAIVLLLEFFVGKFDTSTLVKFLISAVLLCVGEVLFLTGIDSTIMPMGDMVGSSAKKISNFFIFLFFAFLFGMFATIAEPDVQTLSEQIIESGIAINKSVILFVIGAGVGVFVAFALIRIVKHMSIRVLMLVLYFITFILATFVPDSFVAIAFDSGASTLGMVTSPFVLAMCAGVASKNKTNNETFGAIGIASVGPIIAMLILGLFLRGSSAEAIVSGSKYSIFVQVLYNTTMAIVPLVSVFYLFQIIFIKLPRKKKLSLILGVIVTFVGLYLFLFSIDYGIIEMGSAIGEMLASKNIYLVLLIYALIAFVIVFSEPSIRVLGAQIEAETQGNINRKFVVFALAISMLIAAVLAVVRVYFDISIWYFLGIGYLLIAVLMIFSDTTFVAIAFDSGGVAVGSLSTAFVMPAMIAMSTSGAGGFGFVAISSMVPIIVLEIIGIVYNVKVNGFVKRSKRIFARVSYGVDKYSNITKLEQRYKEIKEQKLNEKEQNGN